MTYKLSPESPRRAAARAFGVRLRTLMAKRRIGRRRLEKLCGVGDTSIANYRAGLSLPRLESAKAIADVLGDEQLVHIVVDARTYTCPVDGRRFTYDGEGPRVYCSIDCQRVSEKQRAGQNVRVVTTGLKRRLATFAGAVDAMCRSCEPEGQCRTADCPLRAVSPLPLRVEAAS